LLIQAKAQQPLFEYLDATKTKVSFTNKVIETVERNISSYDYIFNGSGVAIGDLNNDDKPDLFFAGNDTPNKLYFNKGKFKFVDVSKKAGIETDKWATGVTLVDINNDGWLDIYVCYSGPDYKTKSTANELYINQKNGTFKEEAEAYGIADNSLSTQAAFFDFDQDGDLDLFVLNHAVRSLANLPHLWLKATKELPKAVHDRFCNTLYRNEGNGKFKDISGKAGILKIGFGLGISVTDFNNDGWLDVYIANDYFLPDFYFKNNGNGTFTDKTTKKMAHTPFFSMGCDAADINNDGWSDLVVLDMTPKDHYRNKTMMNSMNVLEFKYLTEGLKYTPQYMFNSLNINHGFGVLSDIGHLAGISQTDWSWAPLLADFDNDGYKDLYVSNGFKRDVKNNDWRLKLIDLKLSGNDSPEAYFKHLQTAKVHPIPNEVFKNTNGYQFEEKSNDWGLNKSSFSNGTAYGDLDGDGDLDLVVNNYDQPAFICKNTTRENGGGNFVQLKFTKKIAEGSPVVKKVMVYADHQTQVQEKQFTRGYQSYMQPIMHFGIGKSEQVDQIRIEWSDGNATVLKNLKANKRYDVQSGEKVPNKRPYNEGPKFANITRESIRPTFFHYENEYDDFQNETLLPHRQSRMGPGLTAGDVNGDGLEDFLVGGAKKQLPLLYLQQSDGTFKVKQNNAFFQHRNREIVNALLFDCDNDNDLDLYIVCGGGGAFVLETGDQLQDVLYLNDGTGNFTSSDSLLPIMHTSTKAIAAHDWDNDGDLDLFVGGRTTPGKYPLPPSSYLLENKGGIYMDVTKSMAPYLSDLGMVTDAIWVDTDGDKKQDLIVVGEWMPVTQLLNKGTYFEKSKDDLIPNSNGWWSAIEKADFDNDGDEDLIIGNLGLNNKFHPTTAHPLQLFANDYDDNGTLDIVLSKWYNDTLVPLRGKECSTVQMPFIENKFPTYDAFASASLTDILGDKKQKESIQLKAYAFASIYLKNKGDGTFEQTILPVEMQTAPINDMVVKDFNKDGKLDVFLAGNNIQTEVETTPYDAGKGLYLIGNGDGTFTTSLLGKHAGTLLPGDVKALQLIHLGKDKTPGILVGNNHGRLILLKSSQ
jgi:hypothetical protein